MFGSGILDTVIGVIFIFLLVSLLVTILNEMIAAAFMSRAKWLRLGIDRLIGSEWMAKVYDHPLIEGTGRQKTTLVRNPGPSYIPSRSFANVLMSIVQKNAGAIAECQDAMRTALDKAAAAGGTFDSVREQLSAAAGEMQQKGGLCASVAGDVVRLLAALEDRHTLAQLSAAGADAKAAANALRMHVTDIQWFIDGISARYVRQTIEALPAGDLRTALLTLYEDAHHDVEKLKENIEVWFNNAMDRVNGWYKRQSQLVISVLALVLAVAMNVDTILIFKHLQTYPAAREALVGQATRFAQANPVPAQGEFTVANREAFSGVLHLKPADTERKVTITSDNPDVKVREQQPVTVAKGAAQVAFTADVDMGSKDQPGVATIKSADATDEVKLTLTPSLLKQFDTVQKKVADLTIPIGWVSKEAGTPAEQQNGQVRPGFGDVNAQLKLLQLHALGWLLTALAATLGAPFWFDMLNRVISIRAAGKPPEEEPKPPKAVPVPVEPGQSQQEADWIRQGNPRKR